MADTAGGKGQFMPDFKAPPVNDPVAAPSPPPPVFSEADIAAADKEGYQKGFLAGIEEGRAQAVSEQMLVERQLDATMRELSGKILPLLADYHAFVCQQQENIPRLAIAMARKVAGVALGEDPLPVVEEVTLKAYHTLAGEPHMVITVHESLADALENSLYKHLAGDNTPMEIIINRDDAIAPSDCRIEWQNGELERNAEALWQQVEKALGDITATALRETEKRLSALDERINRKEE